MAGKQAKLKKRRPAQVLKPRKVKIRVIGLGGGGTSMAGEMAQIIPQASFVVADTDSRVFKQAGSMKKKPRVFQFGQNLLKGMGTGMDPELAEKAALQQKDKISQLFDGQDLVLLVGALGGGVCSGAGPVFASEAKKHKGIVLGIFTLPFQFEGEKRMKIAKKALDNLRENLSAMVAVPNERIFQIVDKKTPLKKSLSSLNQVFAGWLTGLIEIISRPSLINIDFADLRTILKGQGGMLFFSQVLAAGPARTDEAMKGILQASVLQEAPSHVKCILFNVAGGKDLKIKEVETVSQKIASLNDKAKIIFGISQLPQYTGKLKISLLALSQNGFKEKKMSKAGKVKIKNKPKNGLKQKDSKLKEKPSKSEFHKEQAKDKVKRRSALEVKKQEKEADEIEWSAERDWEIPAFLRSKQS